MYNFDEMHVGLVPPPSSVSDLVLGLKKEKEKKEVFFSKSKREAIPFSLSLSPLTISLSLRRIFHSFLFFSSFGLCGFPTENAKGGARMYMPWGNNNNAGRQAGNAGTRGDGSPAYFDKRDNMITCIYAASLNFFFFCARAPNERGGFRLERIYICC